jgi:hypothetical protein
VNIARSESALKVRDLPYTEFGFSVVCDMNPSSIAKIGVPSAAVMHMPVLEVKPAAEAADADMEDGVNVLA